VLLALGPDRALGDVQAPEKRRWVKPPKPMMNSSSFERANGHKRSVAVDLGGLLVAAVVSGAGVQDRDIARDLLARLRIEHPQVPIV
jgi:hypothetical protein